MFNFESWPTFYGSLTFVNFLRLGQLLGLEPWNLGHAYILKSKGQPYVQFRDLTYLLRFTDYVEFLRLGHFLGYYKG